MSRQRAPTKAELKWLERVFMAEVENRLPFQTKARSSFIGLEADGWVEVYTQVTRIEGPWPAMTVTGWQLTHAGRAIYCASCKDDEGEAK